MWEGPGVDLSLESLKFNQHAFKKRASDPPIQCNKRKWDILGMGWLPLRPENQKHISRCTWFYTGCGGNVCADALLQRRVRNQRSG